jgi:hypothetical protein
MPVRKRACHSAMLPLSCAVLGGFMSLRLLLPLLMSAAVALAALPAQARTPSCR